MTGHAGILGHWKVFDVPPKSIFKSNTNFIVFNLNDTWCFLHLKLYEYTFCVEM